MRDNNIKVREHKNVEVLEQSNDKVEIIEKELIKIKRLVQLKNRSRTTVFRI